MNCGLIAACAFPLFVRWTMQPIEPSLGTRFTTTEPSRRRWLAWLCCSTSQRSDNTTRICNATSPDAALSRVVQVLRRTLLINGLLLSWHRGWFPVLLSVSIICLSAHWALFNTENVLRCLFFLMWRIQIKFSFDCLYEKGVKLMVPLLLCVFSVHGLHDQWEHGQRSNRLPDRSCHQQDICLCKKFPLQCLYCKPFISAFAVTRKPLRVFGFKFSGAYFIIFMRFLFLWKTEGW